MKNRRLAWLVAGCVVAGGFAPVERVSQAQEQSKEAAAFQFTEIDKQVLDEAKTTDEVFQHKGLVLHDADLQAYVDMVGARVLGNRAAPENVSFQFRVLRDPMVQAFALPNGSVYVTMGLLALLQNEAQLAGVLAHETAHVYERHGYLENRSVRKKMLTINILQIAAGAVPIGPNVGVVVSAFGAALQLGAMASSVALVASVFGYSREMEHEADSDGLIAMTAAHYSPAELAKGFGLLKDDSHLEFEPFTTFYRDHPKLEERETFAAGYAANHAGEKLEIGDEKEYLAKVAPAVCAEIESDIHSRRARTAVARATRLNGMFPENLRYRTLLADAYRALGPKTAVPTDEEKTSHGQSEHRKEYFKMTEQEETARLLKTSEGQAALKASQEKAEGLYKNVLSDDGNFSAALRGLGFLYEDEARYDEAVVEYKAYLSVEAGTSMDHMRMERRLAAVQKLADAAASAGTTKN